MTGGYAGVRLPLPASVERLTDEEVRKRLVEAQRDVWTGTVRLVDRPGFPFRHAGRSTETRRKRERCLPGGSYGACW